MTVLHIVYLSWRFIVLHSFCVLEKNHLLCDTVRVYVAV